MEDNKDINLISYRLSQLEIGLKTVQDTLANISDKLSQMASLQERVADLEAEMSKIKGKVEELEAAPYKKDASKWQTIIGWILQALILAVMAVILAKVGLK